MCKWKFKRFLTSLLANGRGILTDLCVQSISNSLIGSGSRILSCSRKEYGKVWLATCVTLNFRKDLPNHTVVFQTFTVPFNSWIKSHHHPDITVSIGSWGSLSFKLFNTGDCCSAHGYKQRELLSCTVHAMLLLHLHCWTAIASGDEPQKINIWDFSSIAIMEKLRQMCAAKK